MDRYLLKIDRAAKAGRLRITWRALAGLGAAVALFALAGDGGVRSAVSHQDPLEILNLQAKANAFILLDTSGSMGDAMTSTGSGNRATGETDPQNKLHTAKTVLRSIVDANEETVVFSFGTYDQGSISLQSANNRFGYYTTSTLSPSMSTNQITISTNSCNSSLPVHRSSSSNTWLETDGTTTHYTLSADRFINGVTYRLYSNGCVCSTAAGTATNPPSVTLVKVNSTTNCNAATLSSATFTFTGPYDYNAWGTNSGSCQGYLSRVPLAACSQTDQLVAGGIGAFLEPSLRMSATGTTIAGYAENASGTITSQPTVNGLRASGYTPIANSLIDLRGYWNALWATISAQETRQSTFAIVVTDGMDSCDTRSHYAGEGDEDTMLRAAYDAQVLYQSHNDGTGPSRFKTFVIYVGPPDATRQLRANWVAWGGTGMQRTPTGAGEATQWQSGPADKSGCPTCVDAFMASNTDELTAALQSVINMGQIGDFSDRSAIVSVYEELPPATALEPSLRYSTSVPVFFQSTWTVPGFQGHFQAWKSDAAGTTAVSAWGSVTNDAGQKLMNRLSISGSVIFTNLHGGATDSNIGSSAAAIKRRIYTSEGNGRNTAYSVDNLIDRANMASKRVTLWPPEAAVLAGNYDAPLGLTTYTFDQLKTNFGACLGTPLPSGCTGTAAQQLAQGRKEAREMVLAYMAGASVSRASGITPNRVPNGGTAGQILYTARDWILAESTMAAPAVADQPPGPPVKPDVHVPEWGQFVSGPAAGSTAATVMAGFGLKHPDDDATKSNAAIKPVMTVVYLPANDMLHAFRAGPCIASCAETGGEELWGFVPYDQLSKLTKRLVSPDTSTTDRSNHNYMMAAPVRLAHVFVPGDWTRGYGSGAGVWRTVLLAGRGAGGKYLTALDVTMPGPSTVASLDATAPIVMWNRGKDDGVDSSYAGMGDTWSVPAVGPVQAGVFGTQEKAVAFAGSGYGDLASEGTTIYAIDVLSGDVLSAYDVDPGGGLTNALVASPSLYQPNLLDFRNVPALAATDLATAVYFPDVKGRIYRWDLTTSGTTPAVLKDYTAAQPIGVAMMLINTKSETGATAGKKPHVFAVSGADDRVTSANFKIFGVRDDSAGASVTATEVYAPPVDFEAGYRGTVQPVGLFDGEGHAIAMFVGTKYTPAETDCVSRFDSVLYMLEAGLNALPAYDLPDQGGRAVEIAGQKVTDLGVASGQAWMAGGKNPGAPPAPPEQIGQQKPVEVFSGPPPDPYNPGATLAPWPGTTVFKHGSSAACR